MRRFVAVFVFSLVACVAAVQAQNIQLHYDFGRNLYDDLGERPLFTTTVEKFQPDSWGSTYFFVDMDYASEGVASAYWEIARELKFWNNPFSVQSNHGLLKLQIILDIQRYLSCAFPVPSAVLRSGGQDDGGGLIHGKFQPFPFAPCIRHVSGPIL